MKRGSLRDIVSFKDPLSYMLGKFYFSSIQGVQGKNFPAAFRRVLSWHAFVSAEKELCSLKLGSPSGRTWILIHVLVC